MIEDKIALIKNELAGLSPDVCLVAATKTVSAELINRLPEAGIKIVGENRVQELLDKYDAVKGVEWHFIGALQTNKVKYIIDKVSLIQSVDRAALADEIDRQAAKRGLTANVLVEVNMGKEESKSGVYPEKLFELLRYLADKKSIQVRGLMSVMPVGADEGLYKALKEIFEKAKLIYAQMEILSVGMSGDYQTAVKNGSTMVRLGSAIFGKRN